MRKKYSIDDLQSFANHKGGICLSTEYTRLNDTYQWLCKEGHVFENSFGKIKYGQWCPACAGNKKLTIEDMKIFALEKGGICLSNEYINSRTPLNWKCKHGHVFENSANKIQQGRWCPYCTNQRRTIEDVREYGKTRHIELLSTEYNNRKERLEWKCKIGHVFERTFSSLTSSDIPTIETGCPICEKEKAKGKRIRWNIQLVKEKMREYSAECLENEYINNKVPMKFKCEKGHIWISRWDKIFNKRNWCPFCSGNIKKSLEQAHALAKRVNGICHSTEYINIRTPLLWECEKGHRFEKSFYEVSVNNTWCTICSRQVKHTIEEMREIAAFFGGKCLSDEYKNNKIDLLWECGKGHQWTAPPSRIYQSLSWCNECRKLDFNDLKKIAEERGGRCLSNKYINAITPLLWECKNGHQWLARPNNIKRGSWCLKCFQNKLK